AVFVDTAIEELSACSNLFVCWSGQPHRVISRLIKPRLVPSDIRRIVPPMVAVVREDRVPVHQTGDAATLPESSLYRRDVKRVIQRDFDGFSRFHRRRQLDDKKRIGLRIEMETQRRIARRYRLNVYAPSDRIYPLARINTERLQSSLIRLE